jgi:uncharacterized protein (TIGR02996 family)
VSDESALLAAIRANPDEDTPRLVYADWLDEQGGASNAVRAEHIRLQIERAHIDEDDLNPEVVARRKELGARIGPIEKKYKKAWGAELTGKKGPLRGRDCFFHLRRGFPEQAHAPADRLIAEGEALFRLAPITNLNVKALTPENLGPLLACPWLINVRELTLAGPYGEAPHPDWEALADCPHLKNLSYLWIARGKLSRHGGARIAAADPFPRLRNFMMSQDELGGAFVAGLFGGPAFGQLAEVYVHKSGLGTAEVETIAHSSATVGLTKLSLPNQPLSAEATTALAAGPYWPNLRELVLWSCDVGDDGTEALADAGPTRLRVLNLSRNDLGPPAAAALAKSRILETVEDLDLSSNPLGDHGVGALVCYPYLGNLRRLHLGGCYLGPAGAKALAGCPALCGLSWLTLHSNAILAEGALALADSPHLGKLEYMPLSNIRGKARTRLKERFGAAVRF